MQTYWMQANNARICMVTVPEALRGLAETDGALTIRLILAAGLLPDGSKQLQDPNHLWGTVIPDLLTVDALGNLVVDTVKQAFFNAATPASHPATVTVMRGS